MQMRVKKQNNLPKIVKKRNFYKDFSLFILPFRKKFVPSLQNCKYKS